jgi:hypothetical protein
MPWRKSYIWWYFVLSMIYRLFTEYLPINWKERLWNYILVWLFQSFSLWDLRWRHTWILD